MLRFVWLEHFVECVTYVVSISRRRSIPTASTIHTYPSKTTWQVVIARLGTLFPRSVDAVIIWYTTKHRQERRSSLGQREQAIDSPSCSQHATSRLFAGVKNRRSISREVNSGLHLLHDIAGPSIMSEQKRIWRMVVPIALLALLMCTTLGMVWHHHVNSTPDNCPICHLSHLVVEPSAPGLRVSVLPQTGIGLEPLNPQFTVDSRPENVPARAPPA